MDGEPASFGCVVYRIKKRVLYFVYETKILYLCCVYKTSEEDGSRTDKADYR